jgi:hypothetical protein
VNIDWLAKQNLAFDLLANATLGNPVSAEYTGQADGELLLTGTHEGIVMLSVPLRLDSVIMAAVLSLKSNIKIEPSPNGEVKVGSSPAKADVLHRWLIAAEDWPSFDESPVLDRLRGRLANQGLPVLVFNMDLPTADDPVDPPTDQPSTPDGSQQLRSHRGHKVTPPPSSA